jgi:hypothetical protein
MKHEVLIVNLPLSAYFVPLLITISAYMATIFSNASSILQLSVTFIRALALNPIDACLLTYHSIAIAYGRVRIHPDIMIFT